MNIVETEERKKKITLLKMESKIRQKSRYWKKKSGFIQGYVLNGGFHFSFHEVSIINIRVTTYDLRCGNLATWAAPSSIPYNS